MVACTSDSCLNQIGQQLGAFLIRQPNVFPPQGLRQVSDLYRIVQSS